MADDAYTPEWPTADAQGITKLPQENAMAVASLVLGIISIMLSFIPCVGVVGLILGVLAAIFGHIGRHRAAIVSSYFASRKGMATTGMVLGYIAIALALVSTTFAVYGIISILHFCQASVGACG